MPILECISKAFKSHRLRLGFHKSIHFLKKIIELKSDATEINSGAT